MNVRDNDISRRGTKLLVLLLALGPITLWTGYVLSKLWEWFAVPLGAPLIGVAHMVGILSIAIWFKRSAKDKNDSADKVIFMGLAYPALMLLIGWCAHQFM